VAGLRVGEEQWIRIHPNDASASGGKGRSLITESTAEIQNGGTMQRGEEVENNRP